MRTRIKVCGIRDLPTALQTADLGVDAIGFVLSESPRRVTLDEASRLVESVPSYVTTVAVLRKPTQDEIRAVAKRIGPDLIQTEPLPESEMTGARFIPVFHDSDFVEAVIDAYDPDERDQIVHLEGPGKGGRGIPVDMERAKAIAARHRTVLAGGLNPQNVGDRIGEVRPWAVDVSSGVESSPGKKDPELIRKFVTAVRDADSKGVSN